MKTLATATIAIVGAASFALLPACEKHSAEVTAAKYLKDKKAKAEASPAEKSEPKPEATPATYFGN